MSLGDGVIKSIAGEWPGTAVSAGHFALVTGIVFYADRPDPIALGGASLTIGRACGSGGGSSRDRGRADVTCLSF
ncbi:MAG: hypothetical protein LC634_03440 [Sphingomonadales bacterium]|nr:hypothetical protein [Sphingomonadales bacterium]